MADISLVLLEENYTTENKTGDTARRLGRIGLGNRKD